MFNFRTIISHEATLLTPSDAGQLATRLQSDDPEWSYRVVHNDNGLAFVEVLDEDNALLGKL